MAGRAPNATPFLQGAPAVNDAGVRRKLLLSHVITRLGTQGWMFIAPLVLTRFTPGKILGPAIWGMVTMLSTAFLVPGLGKWADRTNRNTVITLGVVLQFVAVAGSTALILVALGSSEAATGTNWSAIAVFTLLGVIEKLGTMLSDVSVKREWAPQLFEGDEQKSVNSKMSQIDLTTEVVGPFLAGLLITFGGVFSFFMPDTLTAIDIGFVLTGFLNALSFWPQLALLRSIYSTHSQLLQPPEQAKDRKGPVPPEGSWGTWLRHPGGLALLSSSYSLLYLTVLSPHGALLTAVLQLGNVPSWQLSLLRGSGAVLGIFGTMARPCCARCLGNRTADAISVCWLAVWMFIALLSFQAAAGGVAVEGMSLPLLIFMCAVCLGRPGLYAFELGVLNLEQELVDRRHRSAVGAVDTALQSLATVVMYGSGMYWSTVADFGLLVAGSSFFVGLGAVVFLLWLALYKVRRHRHAGVEHGHGHGHDAHAHSHGADEHLHHEHTLQMDELKDVQQDGSIFHEHIFYEPGACAIQ